uniref:Uncharacterized protein n=1 Tax=viral metagenome TaxID=1070528 RepID=A0A6M3L9I5_9ZZZZ
MTEQRELYYITDPKDTNGTNRILSRIADRLDKIEGLKGSPKFYNTLFEFSDGTTARITAGNYHVTQAWENDYK